jgi:biotin transport system substrate-specific component
MLASVLEERSCKETPVNSIEPDTPQAISVGQIRVREMTRISLFTAMAVAASALARFGSGVVPFSLVPFVVCLAGATLGPRSGAYSMLMYMCLGLAGLPVFASPPYGGFSYLMTPSFGFIPGFVLAAYVIGKVLENAPGKVFEKAPGRALSEAQRQRQSTGALAAHFIANVAGILTYYSIGIPYLALILNIYLGQSASLYRVLQIGFVPFIVPDLVKALVAALISRAVVRARIPPQR